MRKRKGKIYKQGIGLSLSFLEPTHIQEKKLSNNIESSLLELSVVMKKKCLKIKKLCNG